MSNSFRVFHFGADPMILKIDQAISDSFSAYCQIAVLDVDLVAVP